MSGRTLLTSRNADVNRFIAKISNHINLVEEETNSLRTKLSKAAEEAKENMDISSQIDNTMKQIADLKDEISIQELIETSFNGLDSLKSLDDSISQLNREIDDESSELEALFQKRNNLQEENQRKLEEVALLNQEEEVLLQRVPNEFVIELKELERTREKYDEDVSNLGIVLSDTISKCDDIEKGYRSDQIFPLLEIIAKNIKKLMDLHELDEDVETSQALVRVHEERDAMFSEISRLRKVDALIDNEVEREKIITLVANEVGERGDVKVTLMKLQEMEAGLREITARKRGKSTMKQNNSRESPAEIKENADLIIQQIKKLEDLQQKIKLETNDMSEKESDMQKELEGYRNTESKVLEISQNLAQALNKIEELSSEIQEGQKKSLSSITNLLEKDEVHRKLSEFSKQLEEKIGERNHKLDNLKNLKREVDYTDSHDDFLHKISEYNEILVSQNDERWS